jgi:hypothetical protein
VGAPVSLRTTTEELRPARARPGEARAGERRQRARFLGETVTLAPRDAGGILDLAIEGLLARLGPALAISLSVWLPFRQIAELLGLSGLDGFSADLYSLAWNALSLVPLGFTASVVASLVGDALVDRRAPVAPAIVRGLARAPGAILILFLTQIAALPLALLCVAPYFLVQWLTFAAVPIHVLEGEALLAPAERARTSVLAYLAGFPRRIGRAIARSVALARGWPSLGRWVLLGVIGQLVLGGVLELGAMALTYPEARDYLRTELSFGGAAAELALGALAALFTALSACLRAALMVAFHLDLCVRREGRDLELALERAEREHASAAGAT